MRIRRCASRLLGSTYCSAAPDAAPPTELPPPPPPPASYTSGGCSSASASGEVCELNRSPWDLIAELDLSNPQEEDVVDRFFVRVTGKPSWLFSSVAVKLEEEEEAAAEVIGTQHEVVRKVAKKKQDGEKKARVKREEGDQDGIGSGGRNAATGWTCKKNDGKRWHCRRPTTRPNSLCDYHLVQSRSYYNPNYENPSLAAAAAVASTTTSTSSKAATTSASTSSKAAPVTASTISKARKKKADDDVGEDFYYYAGFGPFRNKRRGGSNLHESFTNAKEERAPEGDTAEARDHNVEDELCDIAGIAGGDEESDDDYDDTIGCVGNGELRVGDGNDKMAVEKTSYQKRGRKPVKARSLKSLL